MSRQFRSYNANFKKLQRTKKIIYQLWWWKNFFFNVTLFVEKVWRHLTHVQIGLSQRCPSHPRVIFTNILCAAFTSSDPKNAKMTFKSSVLFALLGSARVKASRKMLVKSTPDRHLQVWGCPSQTPLTQPGMGWHSSQLAPVQPSKQLKIFPILVFITFCEPFETTLICYRGGQTFSLAYQI